MKFHFFLWACLALFCQNAVANSTPTEAEKVEETAKTSTKEFVELIPGRQLSLVVNTDNNTLNVNLTGDAENLEWIIFQPKGELVSRISTKTKFDEIKIDNLKTGKYVLMIKDTSGRMLFRTFEK